MSKGNRDKITTVKQLALFVRKAKELRRWACFDFLSTYRAAVTMSWKQGSDIQITNLTKPDLETYRSYLLAFRQFLLNDSDIQVNKVLKLAINRGRHIAFRDELIGLQKGWKAINNRLGGVTLQTTDGRHSIVGYDLFLLWLNGTIFHPDINAEDLFDSFDKLREVKEVEYAKHVGLCSNFIVNLAIVIESGLNTNGFDLLNDFTPHIHPKFIYSAANDEEKAAVIKFWTGTKSFAQTLLVCEQHDQDTVIVVEGLTEDASNLQAVKVELRSCCDDAATKALGVIKYCLAFMENVQMQGPSPQTEPRRILEAEVIDPDDIRAIRVALADHRLLWRRKVGKMRCTVHHMPPGARGFGVDLYHQGVDDQSDAVFLQGCCLSFIEQVLDRLIVNQRKEGLDIVDIRPTVAKAPPGV